MSDEVKMPRCFFCRDELNGEQADAAYCYGCKEYVCEDCEIDDPPTGSHFVDEHQE